MDTSLINKVGIALSISLMMPQALAARVVNPATQDQPPSQEGQVILSNIWSAAHGEKQARPPVDGETSAPPRIPSMEEFMEEEKDRLIEATKNKAKQLTGGLSDSLGGLMGAKSAGDALGGLMAAGQNLSSGGDIKEQLKSAAKNLTDKDQWADFAKSYYEEWKKERAEYLVNIAMYEGGLVQLDVDDRFAKKKDMQETQKPLDKPMHVISGSFEVPVRDQAGRGTCAAFTGSRVMEILLKQNGIDADLSEQYFYWSSKPECQTSRCSEEGSWFYSGYEYSQQSQGPNIPLEQDCPYNPKPVDNNDTQIPLAAGCNRGFAKVRSFEVLRDTYDQVVDALNRNRPVAAAYLLSENFFDNQGMVTLADARKSSREHSGGHAIVLTGYMALPESLWQTEGKVCFLTANSWGKGWGVGGYSCLTEAWVQKYAISHFTVVDSMEVR
jgi:hypothetical protein